MTYALTQVVTILFSLYLYFMVSAILEAVFVWDKDGRMLWEFLIGIGLCIAMYLLYR